MAAPARGVGRSRGCSPSVERLPAEEQARPRRHIAALSGRDRVMAETYGEGGGQKLGSGVWAQKGCGLWVWGGALYIRGRGQVLWGRA